MLNSTLNEVSLSRNKESFLLYPDSLDLDIHICLICTDLVTRPVACNTCHTLFCSSCAQRWKQVSVLCPKKCSPQFNFAPLAQTPEIDLYCPYNKDCCTQILNPETFGPHLASCSFIPAHIKTRLQLQQKSLCLNSHSLQFLADLTLLKPDSLMCANCEQKNLCRTYCEQCQTYYCFRCRKIPKLTKQHCPRPRGSHTYLYKNSSEGVPCNVCGLQPYYRNGMKCYDDLACNILICEECYKKLPQPHGNNVNNVQQEEFELIQALEQIRLMEKSEEQHKNLNKKCCS